MSNPSYSGDGLPRQVASRRGVITTILVVVLAAADSVVGQESWKTDFNQHTVPLEEIVGGGPPKDGIPAIDRPQFESVTDADRWLTDRAPVAVAEFGGEVKAYPLGILIFHEIVNDVVGGQPVSVTYCPLCNTTLAFDRRLDGKVLDFGTTGRLRHSDLIMYDRQTETWWQQATGEAIVGELAGRRLAFLPAPVVSWRELKAAHPQAQVLSRDTGFPRLERHYGSSPYPGYDSRREPRPSFFRIRRDTRLAAMDRIVAIDIGDDPVAVPFRALKKRRVIEVEVNGQPYVVLWTPGTASAVDAERIDDGRDVGASAVFEPTVDGKRLTFKPHDDGRFIDRETGSTWNLLGQALSGPMHGRRLIPVAHGNHFWFAWGAFKPETRIVEK